MSLKDSLNAHHLRLLAIAQNAEDLVSQSPSAELLDLLASLRAATFEAFGAYQGFVHREVYEEAKRIGGSEQQKHAEDLKVACIALANEYQRFAMRWVGRSGADSWPEYRLSALRMASAVRQHIRECRWPVGASVS